MASPIHEQPYRSTSWIGLNQLISSAAEIIAHYIGNPEDAMSFVQNDNVIDDLVENLDSLSLNRRKRVIYCGLTRTKLKTTVFVELTYYHHLKHLVSGKISSRDQGKIDLLTKQPVPG